MNVIIYTKQVTDFLDNYVHAKAGAAGPQKIYSVKYVWSVI